jgi:hypothetical protein
MTNFDYAQDSSRIAWRQTIVTNMIRSSLGGIVFAVIALVVAREPTALVLPLVAPIGWLIVGLPGWLLCQKLSQTPKAVVALGFVVPFLLLGLAGDPLLFLVAKVKPDLIPVERPGLMSFSAVLFVLKPT